MLHVGTGEQRRISYIRINGKIVKKGMETDPIYQRRSEGIDSNPETPERIGRQPDEGRSIR
jgi:hypothetical protein